MDMKPDFKSVYRVDAETRRQSVWHPETLAIAVIIASLWATFVARILLQVFNW